jgi:hypothetical protein
MSKLISLVFLFILTNSTLLAQNELLNIDSLKRDQSEKRQLTETRKIKVDEAIKRIKSSDLSETEINRIIQPFLMDYNVNSYEEFLSKYDSLLMEDQIMLDSIDLQILKIDSLNQIVNAGVLAKTRSDSLKLENERLKSIMNNYMTEVESLKSTSSASIENADLYYYNLHDLKKPKIYFYKCPQDPTKSQYWKVSSNLKNNTLITEAFDYNLIQFERFEEQYDSLGSILIDYKLIGRDSITSTTVVNDDVYLWKSSQDYSYKVKYNSPYGRIEFSKTRKFQRKDSLIIQGSMKEVVIFKGEYRFYNSSTNQTFSYTQFSYYAQGIGFVKYERSTPISDTDYEFINLELESILTKKEWRKLTKRNVPNNTYTPLLKSRSE